jgi:hypothetical protein
MSPGTGLFRRALFAATALAMLTLLPGQPVKASTYSPPWADFMCYHWDGANGLDTRQSCTNAKARSAAAGYHAFAQANVTAEDSMGINFAQSDAIWAMFGHACDEKCITTYDTTYGTTVLRYDANSGGTNLPCGQNDNRDACFHNYTSTQLHRIRLMIFGGCHTACPWGTCQNGHTAAGPNLPKDAVTGKGIDSAIGWDDFISWPHMDTWTDSFFKYGTTPQAQAGGGYYTVFQAAIAAETDVYAKHGGYGGTNRSVTWGSTTKLMPVSYGS